MVMKEERPDQLDEVQHALQNIKHAEADLAKARELENEAERELREAEKVLEEATQIRVFFVGKERFETHRHELTGSEIKAMVPNWQAGNALELEGQGDEPDRIIGDHERVHLPTHHPLHFIAVPSANFGAP